MADGNNARTATSVKLFVLVMDTLVVLGSVLGSYLLRILFVDQQAPINVLDRLSWITVLVIVIHLAVLWLFGQYQVRPHVHPLRTMLSVLVAVLAAYAIIVLIFYFMPTMKIGRIVFTSHVLFAAIGMTAVRLAVMRVVVQQVQEERILVLGTKLPTCDLQGIVDRQKFPPITIVGRFDYGNELGMDTGGTPRGSFKPWDPKEPDIPALESRTFDDVVDAERVSQVLIAPGAVLVDELKRKLIDRKYSGMMVGDFVGFYSRLASKLPLEMLDEQWFVYSDRTDFFQQQLYMRIKRFIDVAFSVTVLACAFPFMLFSASAIKVSSPGAPVLFKQRRFSQNRGVFTLLKFRTMIPDAESKEKTDHVVKNDPRIFFMGKILRKFRLDELPQLINILRGEMSLVGPRPTRPEFADKIKEHIPFYDLRFKVKPGLTGLAQVSMPPPQTIEDNIDKVRYDLHYVQDASLWLDLKIILLTVKAVLSRTG